MARMVTRRIKLFGVFVEALVDVDDDMVENAPAPMNQEQQAFGSRAVIPRPGLELPPGTRFIAKKKLEASDVNPLQSRFLIPSCNEILHVLTDLERNTIVNENKSLRVLVKDCRRRLFDMNFKKWASLNKFVLNKGWIGLVKANQLKKGDVVELWCYRRGSCLCFAVDICERCFIPLADH